MRATVLLMINKVFGTRLSFPPHLPKMQLKRYKISLNKNCIKPSKEFKQAINEALESMEPFMNLQNVFNEYGHFYPLSIIFGKSLKNILPNSSFFDTFERIHLESPTFKSLELHLDNLNISYLLTQKGDIVEKSELSNWIQNNDLEIIEYECDSIISLFI